MEIKDHLLTGSNVRFIKTPNTSGKFSTGLPDTIIIHYTAGSSAESSVKTLTNPGVRASAHLVVGRDGSIFQLAPFDEITWHAGKSEYEGRVGFNKFSIGIEIDNAGVLSKTGDKFISWFGKQYDKNEVMEATHRNEKTPRFWHVFTEEQISAVDEICRLLVDHYKIRMILGHEEISPRRKIDPGPAFPLDKFREKIFNANRDENDREDEPEFKSGRVVATSLNIRAAADGAADKVAKPLPRGTKVKILEKRPGWFRVSAEIEGWVSDRYIEKD